MRIIGGEFKNRLIKVPEGMEVRPTTNQLREAFFNICQHFIEEAIFLDLFAGSGAMGLEALSRGAKKAFFVENNKMSARCINENIKLLHLEDRTKLMQGDALKMLAYLQKTHEKFDIIYIDPPYEPEPSSLYLEVLHFLDESELTNPGGWVFVEKLKIILI